MAAPPRAKRPWEPMGSSFSQHSGTPSAEGDEEHPSGEEPTLPTNSSPSSSSCRTASKTHAGDHPLGASGDSGAAVSIPTAKVAASPAPAIRLPVGFDVCHPYECVWSFSVVSQGP